MKHVYCLVWSGHALNELILNYLFTKAQEMFRDETRYDIIKEETFEGDIKTDFKSAALGDVYGYVFQAMIEWENKTTHIHFIIRKTDINISEITWKGNNRTQYQPSLN